MSEISKDRFKTTKIGDIMLALEEDKVQSVHLVGCGCIVCTYDYPNKEKIVEVQKMERSVSSANDLQRLANSAYFFTIEERSLLIDAVALWISSDIQEAEHLKKYPVAAVKYQERADKLGLLLKKFAGFGCR